jgi:hypothetical protein
MIRVNSMAKARANPNISFTQTVSGNAIPI